MTQFACILVIQLDSYGAQHHPWGLLNKLSKTVAVNETNDLTFPFKLFKYK